MGDKISHFSFQTITTALRHHSCGIQGRIKTRSETLFGKNVGTPPSHKFSDIKVQKLSRYMF